MLLMLLLLLVLLMMVLLLMQDLSLGGTLVLTGIPGMYIVQCQFHYVSVSATVELVNFHVSSSEVFSYKS